METPFSTPFYVTQQRCDAVIPNDPYQNGRSSFRTIPISRVPLSSWSTGGRVHDCCCRSHAERDCYYSGSCHSNLFCKELLYVLHAISHPTTFVLHTYIVTNAQSGLRANVRTYTKSLYVVFVSPLSTAHKCGYGFHQHTSDHHGRLEPHLDLLARSRSLGGAHHGRSR